MDLKPPEENYSGISEDYLNLFQEETGSIHNIEKAVRKKETKDYSIRPLTKRKIKGLENENAKLIEYVIDQVEQKNMKKRIKQRMEKDPEEGKFVESEDDLTLYQQNNLNWEDKYKQGRRFEDLEEGGLSHNTPRLAGLSILEPNPQEFYYAYEKICFLSNI
ncbi:hypothetical protein O181_012602 [Austropuccinia psidii MF-1]|uniref:Uncharacterized protein n=1 Tax=Austropuccinia psidii MF-1 TaxID=1389203 RepID=A0A9Q3GN63_9BASI|nr:hypothetical protein [Austropuccinia psidii MF-1]